jgi:hypothetical protein
MGQVLDVLEVIKRVVLGFGLVFGLPRVNAFQDAQPTADNNVTHTKCNDKSKGFPTVFAPKVLQTQLQLLDGLCASHIRGRVARMSLLLNLSKAR